MYFVTLTKWKQAPAKNRSVIEEFTKKLEDLEKQGIKVRIYWTLGRYDAVSIIEAPSEKDVMKMLLPFQDVVDSETLVAIPRAEAIRLV